MLLDTRNEAGAAAGPYAMPAPGAVSDAGAVAEPEERPDDGLFVLPGGYLDERGELHREVRLGALTGHDEESLAQAAPGIAAAAAVTALLTRCVARVGSIERVDAALVRDLLVCDRDYLVLCLRSFAFGPRIDAVLDCRNPECGKRMDVRFSLDELEFERRAVRSRFFTTRLSSPVLIERDGARDETRLVEFRLPTGADQEELAEVFRADEQSALRLLLARTVKCVGAFKDVDEALIAGLPREACDEIAAQMRRLSPQVEIDVEGACPECGTLCSTRFDIAGFFVAEMRDNLLALEREVHFLALHYHWSEHDILSLTRRKRQRYVELLREELERFD
ncbi:MAG TPA: hypothetical protein VLJ61_18920 [Pyrinomonadaceae bacterium]|nr:hypothetical protein [Pyrinomonadaceae bacterium]